MDADRRIEALVSSAIFDSYNSALKKVYEDVYKERTLVWMTTQRDTVCGVCRDMHGTEFGINQIDEILPAHVNCSCQWVSISELGR
jgi:hypothetical protein